MIWYVPVFCKLRHPPLILSSRGMDFLHSIMVCIANWSTLVDRFGADSKGMDYITWYVHDILRAF